jgi:hypothetical protein
LQPVGITRPRTSPEYNQNSIKKSSIGFCAEGDRGKNTKETGNQKKQILWVLAAVEIRAHSPTKVDLVSKVMVKSSIPGPVNAEYSVDGK